MKPPQLNKPHMIVVVGLPGAGKSFFAQKFSKTFNAPYLDAEFYYDMAKNTSAGNKIVEDVMDKLLSSKQTFVIESGESTRRGRSDLKLLARRRGFKPLFVWVQTDAVEASRRSRMTKRDFEASAKKFHVLDKLDPHVVVSGKHTYQTQLKSVLKKIAVERQTTPAPVPTPARKESTVQRKIALFRGRIMG